MNPVRMQYIRKHVLAHLDPQLLQATPAAPFKGLKVLDVGCGGGLLSEALARLGAEVTGLDASPENTSMATFHAALDPMLEGRVVYRPQTVEKVVEEEGNRRFDVVCSLEVVEHVNDPKVFIGNCLDLVKPGGVAVFSTINRTPASYLFTVLLAEHVLKWVPTGTHDHSKYVTPTELESFIKSAEAKETDGVRLEVVDVSGMALRLLENRWVVLDGDKKGGVLGVAPGCGDLDMNYLMVVKKSGGGGGGVVGGSEKDVGAV
ncbi:hypothetical protein HDU98_000848 [Podochytrium sp. JEL0797]|nr:hypothetical protein HDU98_000848 [Podochytrium sp. JEL0797]